MALNFLFLIIIVISIQNVLTEESDFQLNREILPPEIQTKPSSYERNNYEEIELKASDSRSNVVGEFNAINDNDDDDWSTVPGVAGKDYPNFKTIPQTSFSCVGKKPGGYYADMESGCQVFHVCNARGVKSSFLCSPGSIFNQKYFVCDWWYDVECDNASDLYSLNDQLNRGEIGSIPSSSDSNYDDNNKYQGKDYRDSFNSIDLSLASSGFDVPGLPTNRTDVSQKSSPNTLNRNSDGTNFTWQQIDSGNRRENVFPSSGSDINYLSAATKDWRTSFNGDADKVQSFNGNTGPSFPDEHRPFREDRYDSGRNVLSNDRRALDNVPRGFSKNNVPENNRPDHYSDNNANFFDQGRNNFNRPQNEQTFDRPRTGHQSNDNSNKYVFNQQANFQQDNHKNVIFDQREQTNFVRPFVQNRKEESFNYQQEQFSKQFAPNAKDENFGHRQQDNFARPFNEQRTNVPFDQRHQDNFQDPFPERSQIPGSSHAGELTDRQRDSVPGIIYADAKNEDDIDRKRQKEVDDAVLCKNHNGNADASNQANFHQHNGKVFDDIEANRLTYEKPPEVSESFYSQYNNKLHTSVHKTDGFEKSPSPTDHTFASPSNAEGKFSSFDEVRKNHVQQRSRVRPTGGFRDGLGNGFPSSNRELVGSNAIAGVSEPKLSPGQRPDYQAFGNQPVSQFGLDVNSLSH